MTRLKPGPATGSNLKPLLLTCEILDPGSIKKVDFQQIKCWSMKLFFKKRSI